MERKKKRATLFCLWWKWFFIAYNNKGKWACMKWFLTSPDSRIISGSAAQNADWRQRQAATWKKPLLIIFAKSSSSAAKNHSFQGVKSVRYTSEDCEGKDKGRSTDVSLTVWHQTAEPQPVRFTDTVTDESTGFYSHTDSALMENIICTAGAFHHCVESRLLQIMIVLPGMSCQPTSPTITGRQATARP